MTQLFRRRSEIIVGALGSIDAIKLTNIEEPAQMRVKFKIVRSIKPSPNTAELQIFNLKPDNRKRLEEATDLVASIQAGYIDNTAQIFSGELRRAVSGRDGADIVTLVESGDGEIAFRNARINKSFTAGASVKSVIEALIRELGLGSGNLDDILEGLALDGTGDTLRTGSVMSGQVSKELTWFCDAMGIEWSIQLGNLQFTRNGQSIGTLGRVISPETGLVGIPSVDNDGILNARTFMIPDLVPSRVVEINAEFVQGRYRIEKATYTGDTQGAEWHVDIQAKRLG